MNCTLKCIGGHSQQRRNLKKLNRRLEYKIREAEIISTLRAMSGFDYPGEKLKECYKKLLINQFHDILPGSHINPVYNDAWQIMYTLIKL